MKFYMGPRQWPETIADIQSAGHELVQDIHQAEVLVNTTPNPAKISVPGNIKWVQHCYTGVNQLIDAGVIHDVPWCNTAGAFATPVAESALGLLLSVAHHHKAFALAASWSVARELDQSQAWVYPQAAPKRLAVFGAGGIGKEFIRMVAPFGLHITAVNRSGTQVPGADVTLAMADAAHVWGEADFIVCILPLTPDTAGLVDAAIFRAMKPSALFINVGRGGTVVTEDLVDALRSGEIAGAGLEVVDPEPLPDGHPLYTLPNCTMTPHMAASADVAKYHIGAVFNANAAAWEAGEEMPTRVDVERGY
ncbi:D-isomer specific 2-hydroxyacid dehydrogenase family protein [Corynebacterium lizhenjunii]|uniref:D-isomer specific 2-hydroxyacid dehydrogenase family protein n=1 Tax=Corynebacterium lizhenjunii TaxID=2709394 RepID=UPI0013EE00C6|nr:D-isomer specific 2-hydroxyacid dehydrogenase family protein [Corynebacterium lizhenjunii]